MWFYDEHGCALYDEITQPPEYYPTRTERPIFSTGGQARSPAIAGPTRWSSWAPGTSREDPAAARRRCSSNAGLATFVPFDVTEATLRTAGEKRRDEHPGIGVHAVVGDFHHHLGACPPRVAGGWWPSSAARSATSSPTSAPLPERGAR